MGRTSSSHRHGEQGEHGALLDLDEVAGDVVVTRFEACADFRGADADGPCECCGWLAVDHTAGLAPVIEVTPRAPAVLRRAS